jgi:hypothetical protein
MATKDSQTNYVIEKGAHAAKPRFLKLYFGRKEFIWDVQFSSGAWYRSNYLDKDSEGHPLTGVNKLRGITFGTHLETFLGKFKITQWMVNSARIGWQPNFYETGNIALYAYYHVNGKEHRKEFAQVHVDEEFRITFKVERKGVRVTVKRWVSVHTKTFEYFMPIKTWLRIGYHLYPYFGGRSRAPQLMDITIWEEKESGIKLKIG